MNYCVIVVVQSLSCLSATPWTTACQDSLSFTLSQSLFRFMSIELVILSNHLILCCSFLLFPSISSSIRVFSNQRFIWGGQSFGASASATVFPINIQELFPLGLTGLISLQSKGFSRVFSSTIIEKQQFFGSHPSLWSNSHIHTWLLEKPQLWLDGHLLAK